MTRSCLYVSSLLQHTHSSPQYNPTQSIPKDDNGPKKGVYFGAYRGELMLKKVSLSSN